MQNRVLIFDLGGVLVVNDMFDALPGLMKATPGEDELKAKWLRSEAARKFELGGCSAREFSSAMVREFDLTVSPDEFAAAFAGWPKGFYPGVTGLLSQLRRRYTTACLSNSNELHWTAQVTAHFDRAYSSHLLQRIKPDREVFEFVTADLACRPGDVVFFDDSKPNVEAALDFGWQAHLTLGPEDVSRTLADNGLYP